MIVVTTITAILLTLLSYLYVSFRNRYKFWKKINVPYLEPSFPVGNMHEALKRKHFAFVSNALYKKSKEFGDYCGLFLFKKPCLLVLSPEFAKTILIRDFQYFVDRGVYYNKKSDPLSANLFFIEGDEWRNLRAKLSPTFTSGRMKMMFLTMLNVGNSLVKHVHGLSKDLNEPIEIREYLARFTTDIIGSCAFGIECNSIVNPSSEFRMMGKKMFKFTKFQNLKIFISMLARKQCQWLGVRFNNSDIDDFVFQLVEKTIDYRRTSNIERNDFMQLMINLYDEDGSKGSDGLSISEIAAQSFVFFFAGFETSSTTMTYAIHELASNQAIQDKLRSEIVDSLSKTNNEFTYESILSLSYLDKVICETLRKYPPVATIHRIADKDYQLPSGSIIPAGTFLIIPTYGFHHDPKNFPNPEVFDPERFSAEIKANRHPFAYLPFGEGPRLCIGMRFGLLQTKIGLAKLIQHFKFDICDKTEKKLKIDEINMLFTPLGSVWLKIEKI